MSVTITPPEQLEFRRPFTRITKEIIKIKNPSNQVVIFKIKTTAPKQYCVRPNAGRIESNSEVEVQILLQPFKEEIPEDYKCKDKFLVQTAPITDNSVGQDIAALWSRIENTDKDSIHQHKIKCVFLPAETNTTDEESSSIHDESVATAFSSSQKQQENVPSSTSPLVDNETIENKTRIINIELIAALEKIATLQTQLENAKKEKELRSSNVAKLNSTTQPKHAVHQHLNSFSEGYPPQVVFGVAVLVFIITYIFF